MTGEGVDIFDQLRLTGLRGCPADALAKGDADASGLALKRAEDKFAIHHTVETCPVYVWQIFPQQRRDVGHIGNSVGFALGQRLGRPDQFRI